MHTERCVRRLGLLARPRLALRHLRLGAFELRPAATQLRLNHLELELHRAQRSFLALEGPLQGLGGGLRRALLDGALLAQQAALELIHLMREAIKCHQWQSVSLSRLPSS